MKRLFPLSLILLFVFFAFAGCKQTVPKDLLAPPPDALKNREMQSRRFDSGDEMTIIAACGGVLQDMGYNIDEAETDLGLIVASKTRDATDAGNVIGMAILSGLAQTYVPPDATQQIRVSVVTRPLYEKGDDGETPTQLSEDAIFEASQRVRTALSEYLDDMLGEEECEAVCNIIAAKTAKAMQKDLDIVRVLRGATGSVVVRATFQRVIYNTLGQVSFREQINEPEVYQEFYNKLAQSIFLEAHGI